ncbi:MAG: putative DNA binding domain-containing protein [Nitrospirae bacterium]|nr:putative DNA binding domain-containing protein [Nitrospirota bacterium]
MMKSLELEDIEKIEANCEGQDKEFKSARGGFPRSFWETYSALANTDGGAILLGVAEDEFGDVLADGLTAKQIDEYQKIFWDTVNNRGKVSRNLLTTAHVQVVEIKDARILVVHVPRASRSERPVYLGPTPFGNTFRRSHEGDYHCTEDEVRRMLADADPEAADQRILQGFSIDDLDPVSLAQYRRRFSATKPDHPWLTLEIPELLEKLGGWRRDRATGKSGLTLAGLLMFGKHQTIVDPQAAPRYFVDYREKLDLTQRWSDRIYPDGTWEANLFQFYQRVWPKITVDLRVPFRLEGVQRKDETPVHEALREAFVNALVHADYTAPGGIVIEKARDRFAMENPGTLLVSLEQMRRGGVSECRNKSLQQMFIMIGGGERAGSGYDRIQSGWRSQHWRAPALTTQFQPERVRLVMPMISLIPEDALTALQKQFGDRFNSLSKQEVQALATAYLEGEVSNVRLQELLTDHPVEITRLLQGLCEQGYLLSDNRRRWTKYRLAQIGDSSHLPQESLHLEGDSSYSGRDSSYSENNSSYKAEDEKALMSIAASIASTVRAPAQEVRKVIIELCKGRFLTVESLSGLLNRNPAGIRNQYLTPMVREGILRLRYPETPNRPDQAYTSVEGSK